MRESKIKPETKAKLTYEGKDFEFQVYSGTQGPNVVDIRKLYDQVDIFTYDPGFTSTASTESHITFIDGDKGVLQYRGYSIGDLAEHSTFLESCYLLLYGELPTEAQMDELSQDVRDILADNVPKDLRTAVKRGIAVAGNGMLRGGAPLHVRSAGQRRKADQIAHGVNVRHVRIR